MQIGIRSDDVISMELIATEALVYARPPLPFSDMSATY